MKGGEQKSGIITIRRAANLDVDEITRLFYETITTVNGQHYDADQIAAWRAGHADKKRWLTKISEQTFLLAEQSHKLTGFGSITHDGYLDCLFVHRDHQHQGIATRLLKSIEEVAVDLSIQSIYSNVSITALPFFEHNGFVIEQKQTVKTNGVEMDNYRMLKVRAVR